MGPYLQIMGTQIYTRHPSDDPLLGFHTDAGPSLQQIHPHPQSLPLQFKVQFFLTDVSQPDSANFNAGAGQSAKARSLNTQNPDLSQTVQSKYSLIQAMPLSFRGHNGTRSDRIKQIGSEKALPSATARCGAVPTITKRLPSHVLERMTPRRKRLFGYMGEDYHPTDYFKPHDQLEVILGDEWKL